MFGRQSNCQLHTCKPNSGRKEGMKEGEGREEGGRRKKERQGKKGREAFKNNYLLNCVYPPPSIHTFSFKKLFLMSHILTFAKIPMSRLNDQNLAALYDKKMRYSLGIEWRSAIGKNVPAGDNYI